MVISSFSGVALPLLSVQVGITCTSVLCSGGCLPRKASSASKAAKVCHLCRVISSQYQGDQRVSGKPRSSTTGNHLPTLVLEWLACASTMGDATVDLMLVAQEWYPVPSESKAKYRTMNET